MKLEESFPGASIRKASGGRVLASWGPLNILISAWSQSGPDLELARQGALQALGVFREVAQHKELVRQNILNAIKVQHCPEVVARMVQAVASLNEPDFTPLAAVAGSIADEVADFLMEKGAKKALVDNGGDIAIRLRPGNSIAVGIKTDIQKQQVDYIFSVKAEDEIEGVATSGFGGRSFTKGIATAAVAVAKSGAMADAAATLLGNSTYVQDRAIEQVLAEKIDPGTDIPGHLVTLKMGKLSRAKVEKALAQGLLKAQELKARGIIKEALIAIGELSRMTDELRFRRLAR